MMKKILFLIVTIGVCVSHSSSQVPGAVKQRYEKLPAFYPLKYGSIQPAGWLRDWCVQAKNGLVMRNPAFKEAWFNGHPPTFLNEQSAYWIDGMMRLGLVLQDQDLIQKASRDINSVIQNNYLYPSSWATAVYGRAILAYYYGTSDEKALNYLSGFFENANLFGFTDVTDMKPPNDPRGKFIATTQPRNLIQAEAMLETYTLTGDKKVLSKALEGLDAYAGRFVGHWTGSRVEKLDHKGCFAGMDSSVFQTLPPYKDAFMACLSAMHGVSYNEFAKLWAIGYLFNGNADYLKASVHAYKLLDSLHMMPYGVNSSWENIMGISPELGTETCDIADFINSNIWLYRVTGHASYGDRIEKAFFNAAPAAVDGDFKRLAYLQSANALQIDDKYAFREVHEPKCCNGNVARLLPNYILHMAMATNDKGVALNMYGPSRVQTNIGGKAIAFESITEYPFRDKVTIRFKQEQASKFPVYLRIPAWSKKFKVTVNKQVMECDSINGFIKIERVWRKNDEIALHLHAETRLVEGITKSNGAVSSLTGSDAAIAGNKFFTVEHGPLLFALDLPAGTVPRHTIANRSFQINHQPVRQRFSWNQAPISITASMVETDWNNAPKLPLSVKRVNQGVQKVVLIPYGSIHGRKVSVFPFYGG